MEDLLYLKKHGVKNTYTFLIDSAKRDTQSYPSPAEYVVEFNSPFRKVLGIELLDAHIPKTENAITSTSNTLVYTVDGSTKRTAVVPPGPYTVSSLLTALNAALLDGLAVAASNGRASFTAPAEFRLFVSESTLAPTLGFLSSIRTAVSTSKAYVPHALVDVSGPRVIVVRCPEVETLVQHDRHFEKWNPGIGVVKFQAYGHTTVSDYSPLPLQFATTPLARLGSITIRLEKSNGFLYDTGGLDHALILRIHWLDAPEMGFSGGATYTSTLNPNYSATPADEGRQETGRDKSDRQGTRDNADLNWRHAIWGGGAAR